MIKVDKTEKNQVKHALRWGIEVYFKEAVITVLISPKYT
jgi:hypothetical protein